MGVKKKKRQEINLKIQCHYFKGFTQITLLNKTNRPKWEEIHRSLERMDRHLHEHMHLPLNRIIRIELN